MLGVLREVASEYAVVSLPCMLTGFVRRSGKGPPLTQVLPPVDTIMAFSILQTTTEQLSGKSQSKSSKTADTIKKRRIELSPLPNHVNAGVRLDQFLSSAYNTNSETSSNNESSMIVRGRIVSIEDHGCIVDLGGIASSVAGSGERKMQAFLKFENIEGSYEIVDEDDEMEEDDVEDQDNHKEKDADSTKTAAMEIDNNNPTRLLNKHRLYDFAISPSSNTNAGSQSILQLTLPSPQTLSTMRTTSNIKMAPSLSSLMPGMLMEVQVEQYAKNGMCLSFMKGVYRGAVDEDHLGGWRGVDEKGSGGKNSHKKLDVGGDPSMWWKNVFRGKHAKVRCFVRSFVY